MHSTDSSDPFNLYRNPTRIENLNASKNYKRGFNDLHSTYTTSTQRVQHAVSPRSIQATEPFEEHPASYKYGGLPMFLPNRHSRDFREEKNVPERPSSTACYYVNSHKDTRVDSMRRKRTSHRNTLERRQQQRPPPSRASTSLGFRNGLKSPRRKRDLRLIHRATTPNHCRINLKTRPGRSGWYSSLPETAESAIGHRTHVLATVPYRPRTSLQRRHRTQQTEPGVHESGTVTIGTSVFQIDSLQSGFDGSSTARRYRASVGIEDFNCGGGGGGDGEQEPLLDASALPSTTANGLALKSVSFDANALVDDMEEYEEDAGFDLPTPRKTSPARMTSPRTMTPRPESSLQPSYAMVPGILKITPNKVALLDAKKHQTFTLRLPIKNCTNACLAHISPDQIQLKTHNVFAKLISHPTLLAPKMVAMFVLQVVGIGGDGRVMICFMGKELCRIDVFGEKC